VEAQSSAIVELPAMNALTTAIIYFGTFLVLGVAVRFLVRRRMADVDLKDLQDQAGPNRQRRVFLLGGWRSEG
jgi:hypothetical protein